MDGVAVVGNSTIEDVDKGLERLERIQGKLGDFRLLLLFSMRFAVWDTTILVTSNHIPYYSGAGLVFQEQNLAFRVEQKARLQPGFLFVG